MAANVAVSQILLTERSLWRKLWAGSLALWLLAPLIYSYYTYFNYVDQGAGVEVVTIQPNIDPATRAFVDTEEILSMENRMERFIALSESQLTEQTQFLVWPEVALDDQFFDEELFSDYPLIERLVQFKQQYPQLSLLTGIITLANYPQKASKTAQKDEVYGHYYDVFNSALFVSNQNTLELYHKCKLVPGSELTPYFYNIWLPEAFTAGQGGRLGSLGMQEEPSVFFNKSTVGVAPSICYESIFSEHTAHAVRKGASLIFAITVDGWWRNTPGYQQHCLYTRLRAIETRRSIARSAYKGATVFINQRGDILQQLSYHQQGAIRETLKANTKLTFYVQYPEVLPFLALLGTFVFIPLVLIGIRIEAKIKRIEEALTAAGKEIPWKK